MASFPYFAGAEANYSRVAQLVPMQLDWLESMLLNGKLRV